MHKNKTVIAEFSIIPIGQEGTSVSSYVVAAVSSFQDVEGLRFELTAMGTILEAENLETIFEAVRRAHNALYKSGVQRISSTLIIDDRKDKARSMNDKVKAVKDKLT